MRRRSFLSCFAAGALPPVARAQRSRGKLKISAVEVWQLEGSRKVVRDADRQPTKAMVPTRALYLKIKTDAGVEGLYGPIDRAAAIVVDRQLRPSLIGDDPLAGEALWDKMFHLNRHSRRGHFMMGISAADNALWDLRGRFHGVPVYRLLGGPTRPAVQAYGSCLGFSVEPEPVRRKSVEVKNQGFVHQKWFLAYRPGDGAAGLKKNVELVRNLREALGDEIDIMFDAFSGWYLDYAIAWAKQVEQYRPRWIEEAFHADKIGSFVQLRRSTSVPVATGEHIYNRWEVHEYLKAGAISVVQTDPEWCGGVSELVKICSTASLFDAQVIPHGHSLHAALHVVASQPPMTCPLVEYLINKMRGNYYHFEKDVPKPVNGQIALPDGPGFGIELDESKIERQSVVHWS